VIRNHLVGETAPQRPVQPVIPSGRRIGSDNLRLSRTDGTRGGAPAGAIQRYGQHLAILPGGARECNVLLVGVGRGGADAPRRSLAERLYSMSTTETRGLRPRKTNRTGVYAVHEAAPQQTTHREVVSDIDHQEARKILTPPGGPAAKGLYQA
jgi:hypothetical protein